MILRDGEKDVLNYLIKNNISNKDIPNTMETKLKITKKLTDFDVWKREEGWWFGEYTFLTPTEGLVKYEPKTPFEYRHYYGFIRIELIDGNLIQRNLFIRPPVDLQQFSDSSGNVSAETMRVYGYLTPCDYKLSTDTSGNKIAIPIDYDGQPFNYLQGGESEFEAEQTIVDNDGNLQGPYVTPFGNFPTNSIIKDDNSVLYNVKIGSAIIQNQLTTLPNSNYRVRTAQGFGNGYASYYREVKLSGESEFFTKLEEYRNTYNIDGKSLDDIKKHFDTNKSLYSYPYFIPKPILSNTTIPNLNTFEAWRREEGLWFGKYTFLNNNGNNDYNINKFYNYRHYYGFIKIELKNDTLKQTNIFLRPPLLDLPKLDINNNNIIEKDELEKHGYNGTHRLKMNIDDDNVSLIDASGNELETFNYKQGGYSLFNAEQKAIDNKGTLYGKYFYTFDTYSTIYNNDTVLYQVFDTNGHIIQNQLTTLPTNKSRTRTAQGFDSNGNSTYSSYYIEDKLTPNDFISKFLEIVNNNYIDIQENGISVQDLQQYCRTYFNIPIE